MDRSIARPGRISVACVCSGLSLSLFMTKVIPADALGLLGFIKGWTAIHLPKSWLMSVIWWWSRCVSCRQRILICFWWISLWTSVHLEIWLHEVVFEWERSFMLRMAIDMFAHDRLWFCCGGSSPWFLGGMSVLDCL